MFDDANKLIELAPNYRLATSFAAMPISKSASNRLRSTTSPRLFPSIPAPSYGYRMRGRAYYFLNQFDNAMADFQAALRIDAKDDSTLSFINDLKRRQRGPVSIRITRG